MTERSSIFDMIGPVMIGPSSSHTAGVARIGRMAHLLFGSVPSRAVITFYNSFAHTYEGHGSDRAILAGLLGLSPEDEQLRDGLELARKAGIDYQFKSVASNPRLHPNSIRVEIGKDTETFELMGVSRGGGIITIREINRFHANLSGSLTTLVIQADDRPGSIAFIADVLAADQCNIATMNVSRQGKFHHALQVLELDSDPRPLTLDFLRSMSWVRSVRWVSASQLGGL
jgi:L-serine dehydratase